jgi:hypothetical protein
MSKTIVTIFTEDGVGKTGLVPLITILDVSDNSTVVSGQAMTELSLGFYKYSFDEYDYTKDYVFMCDGTSFLNSYERYNYSSSEAVTDLDDIASDITNILKINKNRWKRDGTQFTIYDDNGTSVLYAFDLKKANGTSAGENDPVFERTPA